MIGPKKLSRVRQELHGALTVTGHDPIRWLEERMSAPERQELAASGESEVLQSLRRVLEGTGRPKRGKKRVASSRVAEAES